MSRIQSIPCVVMIFCAFASLLGAEGNLFPDDGYFSVQSASAWVLSKQPRGCSSSFVPGRYENSSAIWTIVNDSDSEVQISTRQTYPMSGDLMVLEVTARSLDTPGRPFSVIGMTPDYKHIAHKHYQMTAKWRTYVAILPVPAAGEAKSRLWRGRIDLSAGARLEIGHIALYPSKNDERIAGMADAIESEDRRMAFEPTLHDFAGVAPTSAAFVSSQVGNTNRIVAMQLRRSDEIKDDNVLAAALCDEAIIQCPPVGRFYKTWSPYWAIADEELRQQASRSTFSTHILAASATNASLTVRLSKPVAVTSLRLTPRGKTLAGFPYAWHVDISADGTAFRTVHSVTNEIRSGECPEVSLDGTPVGAIRLVADRIRSEGKGFGYLQLDRLEAYDAAGVNHALISKGATAETAQPMGVSVLDRESYLDDALVNCGVKAVLLRIQVLGGSGDASVKGGLIPGSRGFENLTDNIRYLKEHGVKTFMRMAWGRQLPFDLTTKEELEAFKAEYIAQITPFVTAWKGLVAGYPLGGEENQDCVRGRNKKFDVAFYKQAYREMVMAASEAIHAIDPQAKTSVTSALFDFGWTEDHLKNGLAQTLDEVSVHIYRETDPLGSYPEKCYGFFVDGRRGFESERLFTRAEDEIKAFRTLLDKYNPKLGFACHEMSMRVGPYPKGMNSTELGQAKFALRTYIMHQFYNIGPSCWWTFNGGENLGGIVWGVMRGGRKLEGWHAMRRFAALFDSSWKPTAEQPVTFAPADDRFYSYQFTRGDERLVACWTAVSMRDANTGKQVDAFVPTGTDVWVPAVDCIDLLNGGVQRLLVEPADGGFWVRGLVMRDYPLVFRYSEK